MPNRISARIIGSPRLMAIAIIAISVISGYLASKLRVSSDVELYMDPGSPYKRVLDQVEHDFVSDDTVFIGYEGVDPFSQEALQALRTVGEQLEAATIPGDGGVPLHPVEDVTSLATVKDLAGGKNQFRTIPLVPDPIPTVPAGLARIKARALDNPFVRGLLVTPDAKLGALVVRLVRDLTDAQLEQTIELVRTTLRASTAAYQSAHQGTLTYHVIGEKVAIADGAYYVRKANREMLPVCFLIMTLLLVMYLPKFWAVTVGILSMLICMTVSAASLVATGGVFNNLTSMITPIVLVITVSYVIHTFSELSHGVQDSNDDEAARAALVDVFPALFLMAITDTIGFGSMGWTNIPAIRQFGLASGIAVLAPFFVVPSLAAIAVYYLGSRRVIPTFGLVRSRRFDELITKIAGVAVNHQGKIAALTLAYAVVFGIGLSRLSVEINREDWFTHKTPIRNDMDWVKERFGGYTQFVVVVGRNDNKEMTDPVQLHKVEMLESFVRGLGASYVISPVDFLKLMNKAFFDEDPNRYQVPDTQEQVAQLLLLNGDKRLDEFLHPSYRQIRMVARMKVKNQEESAHIYDQIEEYFRHHFPSQIGYVTHATGINRVNVEMSNQLISGQAWSLITAVPMCILMIGLLFRSLGAALYSLVPNLFPLLTTFGMLEWAGIPFNDATILVAAPAFGITVDDTIHFLYAYRHKLKTTTRVDEAIIYGLRSKGAGMIWTSVLIVAGFSTLMLDQYGLPIRHFGLVLSITMFTAAFGDLFVGPAFLALMGARLGVPMPEASEERAPQPARKASHA